VQRSLNFYYGHKWGGGVEKSNEIKILVAESVDLIRMGLRSLFQKHPSIFLVAETNSMENLSTLIMHHKPDIALIDLSLSNGENYQQIKLLLSKNPESKFLFLSQRTDNSVLQKLHSIGVSGLVLKSYPCKLLLKAIYTIHSGQIWFDCHLNQANSNQSNRFFQESQITDNFTSRPILSDRERQIASLACKGLSAKEIGVQLLLTEKTIRNQLSLIYKKIGIKKKVELYLEARYFNNFG